MIENGKHFVKREKLLINPKFQVTIMGYIASLVLTLMVIFFGAITYFFWKFESLGLASGLPADHVFFQFIIVQKKAMYWVLLLAVGITCCFTLGMSLILSHQVAGPIHKICAHLKELANSNELKEVRFRKNDFFPELAEAFNDYVKSRSAKLK